MFLNGTLNFWLLCIDNIDVWILCQFFNESTQHRLHQPMSHDEHKLRTLLTCMSICKCSKSQQSSTCFFTISFPILEQEPHVVWFFLWLVFQPCQNQQAAFLILTCHVAVEKSCVSSGRMLKGNATCLAACMPCSWNHSFLHWKCSWFRWFYLHLRTMNDKMGMRSIQNNSQSCFFLQSPSIQTFKSDHDCLFSVLF